MPACQTLRNAAAAKEEENSHFYRNRVLLYHVPKGSSGNYSSGDRRGGSDVPRLLRSAPGRWWELDLPLLLCSLHIPGRERVLPFAPTRATVGDAGDPPPPPQFQVLLRMGKTARAADGAEPVRKCRPGLSQRMRTGPVSTTLRQRGPQDLRHRRGRRRDLGDGVGPRPGAEARFLCSLF